jgi:hypothetical protein
LREFEVVVDEHLPDDRKHWIERRGKAEGIVARAQARMQAVSAETVARDAGRTVTVTADFEKVLNPVSDADDRLFLRI